MKFADIIIYCICIVMFVALWFVPDNEAVMSAALQRAAYLFAMESIDILETYLPSMFDGLKRDMQIVAEEKYKDVLSD